MSGIFSVYDDYIIIMFTHFFFQGISSAERYESNSRTVLAAVQISIKLSLIVIPHKLIRGDNKVIYGRSGDVIVSKVWTEIH